MYYYVHAISSVRMQTISTHHLRNTIAFTIVFLTILPSSIAKSREDKWLLLLLCTYIILGPLRFLRELAHVKEEAHEKTDSHVPWAIVPDGHTMAFYPS